MTHPTQVSRGILGDDFLGTLVTDCYSGYFASAAGAKQKCLFHLAHTACKWQKLTKHDSADFAFFEDIKQFVKLGCEFHRLRHDGKLSDAEQSARGAWLREELSRPETCHVSHESRMSTAFLLRMTDLSLDRHRSTPAIPATDTFYGHLNSDQRDS